MFTQYKTGLFDEKEEGPFPSDWPHGEDTRRGAVDLSICSS